MISCEADGDRTAQRATKGHDLVFVDVFSLIEQIVERGLTPTAG
jgi:hypothetical protein